MGSRRVWQCRPTVWGGNRLGDGQAFCCHAAWAASYRWAGCCADVMRCVVLDLAVAACWLGQPREFLQEAVWCRASSDEFYTGKC